MFFANETYCQLLFLQANMNYLAWLQFTFNFRFGVASNVLAFSTYNVFRGGQGKTLVLRNYQQMIQEQKTALRGVGKNRHLHKI